MSQPDDRSPEFEVALERDENFVFTVDFHQDGVPSLRVDEPAPLGEGRGPNATRLLAAAVGNCLAASFLYCLGRRGFDPESVKATVRGRLIRNLQNRLRVEELRVRLDVDTEGADPNRVSRCLEVFEDYCVVTESVRRGIDVLVEVHPAGSVAEAEVGAGVA